MEETKKKEQKEEKREKKKRKKISHTCFCKTKQI